MAKTVKKPLIKLSAKFEFSSGFPASSIVTTSDPTTATLTISSFVGSIEPKK